MRLLCRQLEVLWIMIEAAHDQHVLDSAGHEQIAVSEEPEVAGPEEWSLTRLVEERMKRGRGLLGPIPISTRHAGTGHPDLANLIRSAPNVPDGIDDDDVRAARATAAGNEGCSIPAAPHARHAALAQRVTVDVERDRIVGGGAAGHEQR